MTRVRFPTGARILFLLHRVLAPFQTPRLVKRADLKPTTHFQLVTRSRMVELYLNFPKYLHGVVLNYIIKLPWLYSASKLYRPSDRRLSEKSVPSFADRGCRVVGTTDPHGR
jgi:hypothetical protein